MSQVCPSCGLPLDLPRDECPRCGLAFAEPPVAGDVSSSDAAKSAPPPVSGSAPLSNSSGEIRDDAPPVLSDEPTPPVAVHQQGKRRKKARPAAPPAASDAASDDWRMHFDMAMDRIQQAGGDHGEPTREDYTHALSDLNKAILIAPENELAVCHSTRAYLYLKLEDFDRAEDDCTAALERDANDVEALAWRGLARAGKRQWRQAVEDLTRAISFGTGAAGEYTEIRRTVVEDALAEFREQVRDGHGTEELFFERGRIYELLGESEKALRDFGQSLQVNPEFMEARLGRAAALLGVNQHDEALVECNRVMDGPGTWHREGLKLRAKIHQALGKLDQSIADLSAVKALDPQSIPLHVECGEIRFQIKDYAGAIEDLTFALKQDRRHFQARRLRAEAYRAMRNYELAIQDYKYLLDRHGDDAQLLLERGEAHLRKGEFRSAFNDFNRSLEINDLDARAYHGLSEVFAQSGKSSEAITHCERALRLDSRLELAYITRGKLYFETEEYRQAIGEFTRALRLDPDAEIAADGHYRRGIAYYQLEMYDEALEDLDKSVAERPNHAGSYVWRSCTHAALKMWSEAIRDMKKAIEINPAGAESYRKLGTDACRKAIEHFSAVLARDEDDADAYRQRGFARQFLGQAEGALADLQRAESLDPHRPDVAICRAELIGEEEGLVAAIDEVTRMLEARPKAPEGLYFRSGLLLQANDKEGALRDAAKAIRLQPHESRYRVRLAKILMDRGQIEKAQRELTRAISLDQAGYAAFAARGRCCYLREQYLQAIHDFSRSLEIYPDQPKTIAARGHAYLKNMQFEQGMDDFETALGRDNKIIEAYTGRAIVMAKRGDAEAALIWLTKAIHRFDTAEAWTVLLMTRARIFFNMSRFGRAIGDYTTVISWNPAAPTAAAAIYARGVALLHEGDPANARSDFEEALANDEHYRPARVALQWLQGKVRKRPKALVPPKQLIRPTRPRVVTGEMEYDIDATAWAADAPFDQWIVRTIDGIEFGPAPKAVIDQWCREGRIDEETRLLRSDWEKWKRASVVYPFVDPGFEPADRPPVAKSSPVAEPDSPASVVENSEDAHVAVDYSKFESLDQFLPGSPPDEEPPEIKT